MRGLAAASLSTDEDTKWSSLSSESNCEAKLGSQTAFEGASALSSVKVLKWNCKLIILYVRPGLWN